MLAPRPRAASSGQSSSGAVAPPSTYQAGWPAGEPAHEQHAHRQGAAPLGARPSGLVHPSEERSSLVDRASGYASRRSSSPVHARHPADRELKRGEHEQAAGGYRNVARRLSIHRSEEMEMRAPHSRSSHSSEAPPSSSSEYADERGAAMSGSVYEARALPYGARPTMPSPPQHRSGAWPGPASASSSSINLPPLHQALNMRSATWWPGGASGPGMGPDAPGAGAGAPARPPNMHPLNLPPLSSMGRRRSSGEEDLTQQRHGGGPAHPAQRRRHSPPERPWRPSE